MRKKNGKSILNQQQADFLAYFTDPKSDTFSNARQSALRAGYAEKYALNITSRLPEWLSENVDSMSRLRKAERNLDEVLDLNIRDKKIKPALLGIKSDVSKFVAERLGRKRYGKDKDDSGGGTTNNFIQININPPHGKNTRDQPDRKTIPSVVSP